MILAIGLNYPGNPSHKLNVATKVKILNKIKKVDVVQTNNNAVLALLVQMDVR